MRIEPDWFYELVNNETQSINGLLKADKDALDEFLIHLKKIRQSEDIDVLKLTKMTVLFEGFYCFIDKPLLKEIFLNIRLQRWQNHFGTPTLSFLISYEKQIQDTKNFFNKSDEYQILPWENSSLNCKTFDEKNNIVVNIDDINKIDMPESEKTGEFLKTYNPFGGFVTTPCDPYSLKFVEYANEVAQFGGMVLEIGAGFGAASLNALAKGATVFCNDIEAKNLAVVRNRCLEKKEASGDDKKLILVPAAFPEELSALPKAYFDAILVCRLLHFFEGKKIEDSLKLLGNYLKPRGKLFIICETPFLKNWIKFISEYKKRCSENVEWPGEIDKPEEFETSGRSTTLPTFVHWITKEILDRTVRRTGFFDIEESSYINRKGQFPDDLLLNGQESVGIIAIKKT